MKEPQTDAEFEDALEKLGYQVFDMDSDEFIVLNRKTGSQTKLDAEDLSSALFEAWHLVK